jgi:hypothetical protein
VRTSGCSGRVVCDPFVAQDALMAHRPKEFA